MKSPEQCLQLAGGPALFREPQEPACLQETCVQNSLLVGFPPWGKGTCSTIVAPNPSSLNGALFPEDGLTETSLAIYNMLSSG